MTQRLRLISQPSPSDPGHLDRVIVAGLIRGDAGAPAKLFDRYGVFVERVVFRCLGHDSELADVIHEVFAEALGSIGRLRDATRLKGWLASIAVNRSRAMIRRRQRGRWLHFFSEPPQASSNPNQTEAVVKVERVYRILDKMGVEDRMAITLRRIEGMSLPECAEVLGVSLATFKRRLNRADQRFRRHAATDPLLAEYLENEGETNE